MVSHSRRKWVYRLGISAATLLAIPLAIGFLCSGFHRMTSASMQPTIMSSPVKSGQERFVASSFLYLFREPERWDVVTHRFPLQTQVQKVGRLVGLPGERIVIEGGDLFTVTGGAGSDPAFKLLRKPPAVRDSLLRQVFPGPRVTEIEAFFEITPREGSEGPAAVVTGDRLRFGESGGKVRTRRSIRDDYDHGYPAGVDARRLSRAQNVVNDLGVSLDLTPDHGFGRITINFQEGDQLHTAEITRAGEDSVLRTVAGPEQAVVAEQAMDLPTWEVPETRSLVFLNVDDQLTLALDGEVIGLLDTPTIPPEKRRVNGIEVIVDGAASLAALIVKRDIYYIEAPGREGRMYQVPSDHFLVLGDNVQNSHDSRSWESVSAQDENGRTVTGHHFLAPGPDRNPRRVSGGAVLVDTAGQPQTLAGSPRFTYEDRPFVPREMILGRVWATSGSRRRLIR